MRLGIASLVHFSRTGSRADRYKRWDADLSHYRKFDLKIQPAQSSWRLGANHYLIIGESLVDPPSGATDVTSIYSNLRLVGPMSRTSYPS